MAMNMSRSARKCNQVLNINVCTRGRDNLTIGCPCQMFDFWILISRSFYKDVAYYLP